MREPQLVRIPVGAEDVLVRERHAREWPALAPRDACIRAPRVLDRALARDRHERIQRRVRLLDAVEEVPRDLDARVLARTEPPADLRRGCVMQAHSITFGTR